MTNCADDGSAGTLRKAIEGAADGDTIEMSALACATITLQSGALVSPVPNLKLKGPGIDALTIDGNNVDRVLEGTYLDVSDLTIAHGTVLTGAAGCVLAQGDLSLSRARLTNCLAVSATVGAGGGAAVVFGNLTMHESIISSSKAIGADVAAGGGAIVGNNATLYDSTITGNSAEASQAAAYGGGLYARAIALHATMIDGNSAHSISGPAYGGGVHSVLANIAILDGSAITGNAATSDTTWSYGGGVNSGLNTNPAAATVIVENSTISNNTVDSHCTGCFVAGGGIHALDSIAAAYATIDHNQAVCDDPATACSAGGGGLASFGAQGASSHINLRNCTISTNAAAGGTQVGALGAGGGVLAGFDEQIFVHNTTIAFNHASLLGGGIAQSSTSNPSELISTIVADNDNGAGPSDIEVGPIVNNATMSGSNNIVIAAAAGLTLPADTLGDEPGLLALTTADGGITATHPLAAGSAAIDSGINPDWLGCDQRGYPYRRVHGASADIGAYEFQGERSIFADNFDATSACPPAP